MGELITIPEKPMSPAEIKLRFRSLVGKTPFEIRKAWYPLVQGTLQAIEDALIVAGKQPQDFPEIYPVREKYGMLRLGLTCRTCHALSRSCPDVPRIEQILSEAEDLSMEICIFCGSRGEMRATEWEHPACDPCEKKYLLYEI